MESNNDQIEWLSTCEEELDIKKEHKNKVIHVEEKFKDKVIDVKEEFKNEVVNFEEKFKDKVTDVKEEFKNEVVDFEEELENGIIDVEEKYKNKIIDAEEEFENKIIDVEKLTNKVIGVEETHKNKVIDVEEEQKSKVIHIEEEMRNRVKEGEHYAESNVNVIKCAKNKEVMKVNVTSADGIVIKKGEKKGKNCEILNDESILKYVLNGKAPISRENKTEIKGEVQKVFNNDDTNKNNADNEEMLFYMKTVANNLFKINIDIIKDEEQIITKLFSDVKFRSYYFDFLLLLNATNEQTLTKIALLLGKNKENNNDVCPFEYYVPNKNSQYKRKESTPEIRKNVCKSRPDKNNPMERRENVKKMADKSKQYNDNMLQRNADVPFTVTKTEKPKNKLNKETESKGSKKSYDTERLLSSISAIRGFSASHVPSKIDFHKESSFISSTSGDFDENEISYSNYKNSYKHNKFNYGGDQAFGKSNNTLSFCKQKNGPKFSQYSDDKLTKIFDNKSRSNYKSSIYENIDNDPFQVHSNGFDSFNEQRNKYGIRNKQVKNEIKTHNKHSTNPKFGSSYDSFEENKTGSTKFTTRNISTKNITSLSLSDESDNDDSINKPVKYKEGPSIQHKVGNLGGMADKIHAMLDQL